MQEQQIVIDIPPEIYVSPENIADIKRLVREEICNRFFTWDEIRDYERRVAELVTEDDEPVDNIFSERQQKLLTQTLYTSWKPLNAAGEPLNFFAAANIGLYGKLDRHARIVPDVLVSLGVKAPENVHEKRHRSYLIWEFGKPPELALEIVSNQEGDELGEKLAKYARLGIEYYVVFDSSHFLSDDTLRVYERGPGNGYRLREDFRLPALQLSLTIWRGAFEGVEDDWLRWVGDGGGMLLSSDERAAKLAAKLRALGVDPDAV